MPRARGVARATGGGARATRTAGCCGAWSRAGTTWVIHTLKCNRFLPVRPFGNKQAAVAWTETTVRWYNNDHRHSALHHVTPLRRRRGEDAEILRRCCGVIGKAREENPERWFGDRVFAPEPAREVWINPPPPSRA